MSDLNKHCPDCGRKKAANADDCRFGYCSKWYATRDPEANQDCVEQGIYTQHLKQRIAELEEKVEQFENHVNLAHERMKELESQRKWYSFEIHQPEVNTPYLVRIQHDITYSYDVDILVETDDQFMWVKNSNKIVTHWSHITPPEGE